MSNGCSSSISAAAKLTLCLADSNCDSFVNGDDFDLFASQFESGDPQADINHDGFVNGDDFDMFAEAFDAGC
ncbi:MAG: hypothetical protein JNL50_02265 [Phycisphaerae bacterium]|nr:hypothetical protein [Phycisphaerae bacterium]